MSSHSVGASSQKAQVKQQIASQLNVLDNLRYEGEVLTDKLIKLRSTRQDLEAELFALKHKRIKLLEVIQHLEDEEMALVGEVDSIIRCKRKVLQEVPLLEQRGRAAAGLAVVQDYLLASVQHLQHLAGQQEASAFEVAAAASAPSWSGSADVKRPSATWDMRYMPAALVPKAAASTQTDAAELEAAQLLLESLQLEDSAAPTAQQPAGGQQEAAALAARKQYSTNPFASVTAGQLLQLQQLEEGGSSDALPPLPEGQPLCSRAASAFSSSLYRSSESIRTPLDSSMRGPSSEYRSNPGGPTTSQNSGSVVSLGSTASSGSMQRTGSISSRTSGGAGAAVAAGVAAGAGAAAGLSAAVVGSPSGSFNSMGHRVPPRRPSAEEVSSGAAGRRPVGRTGSGRGLTPSPPPPPPMRSRSGSLAALAAAEQGQLSQQIQQLQLQQQQPLPYNSQQQAALHAQRVQQHQQQQQQLQQQQQQLQQQCQQQLQQHQQALQQDSEVRYMSLLAQRQQLAMQHQQQQALLQQMSGLQAPLGPLDYDHSSAGTLEVPSIPASSLASLHSSNTLPGLSGSLQTSSLLRGASAGPGDPLWGLPSGTLVLGGGEGGSCDLSGALTGLPGVLRQQHSSQRVSWSSQGRPSGDQLVAAAAAAAAAGLGPPAAAAAAAADQQRLLEEALEFACVGNDGMVSRSGSGSSGQHRLQQLAPGPLGPAVGANLMGLLPSPDPTVQAASLYSQQHMQGGGQ